MVAALTKAIMSGGSEKDHLNGNYTRSEGDSHTHIWRGIEQKWLRLDYGIKFFFVSTEEQQQAKSGNK